jgi:hypothetical protein
VLEDQDIVGRLRTRARFRRLPRATTTPARRHLENSSFQLQGIFTLIVVLYKLGVSQRRLVQLYRRLIRQGKL